MHHQLFEARLECLVMTSGNFTEEPIVIDNAEARAKLTPLVDHFLLHNRDIFMRADDSVARCYEGAPRMIRRARGYAPEPIDLGVEFQEAWGVGAELKNTFCLTKSHYPFSASTLAILRTSKRTFFRGNAPPSHWGSGTPHG
jgi:hydrogenase maturation protein HypF